MCRAGACLVALVGALWIAPAASAASGNRIAIAVSPHVRKQHPYNVSIQGFARRSATAYLFIDYAGCAKPFAAERQRAGKAHQRYAVKGAFTKVSGWNSSAAGVDHACAYLIGLQSRTVVASKQVAFRIH